MKKFLIMILSLVCTLLIISCNNNNYKDLKDNTLNNDDNSKTQSLINENGTTIANRFAPPKNFKRVEVQEGSFEEYLRNQPLKPHGSEVKYFNGKVKPNSSIYDGVLNIDVGERDLQQCADAVMRLRAEYLYKNKKYNDIHFNFVNGFKADYSKWTNGYRVSFSNNKASWVKKASPSTDYKSFRNYLDIVFAYAGTASLHKELNSITMKDMKIGDVFIQTKQPYGHAIIVVDMAENEKGEKLFMVAQSYMPAQDIQILHNGNDSNISPWYKLDSSEIIATPEWKFSKDDLKRF